tara:strand:- start:12921 stop:15203 length:2283 start_codon:yes stop_codon:yes gene_type:complete
MPAAGKSWQETLAEFLRTKGNLEAILVKPEERLIAVATLGTSDDGELESLLRETLSRVIDDLESERDPTKWKMFPVNRNQGILVKNIDGQLLFEKESCPTAPQFWKWREFSWPEEEDLEEESTGEEWRFLAIMAGICGISLGLGFILQKAGTISFPIAIGFYAVSMIAGGWDAAIDTFHKVRRGVLDIHFLMLAVAIGATSIGAYIEGALLLFLFSLSGALEHFAVYRTHREIGSLVANAPKTARVVQAEDRLETVPIGEVEVGQIVQVKPDELFPIDGTLISGKTAADEANLTGESVPVEKESGDKIFGGTLNLWGSVQIRVTRRAEDSSLQKIIRLIHQAQKQRAPSQRFTDRFGTHYTYLVLAATTLVFLGWWLFMGLPPFVGDESNPSAFYRAMTFLVVASPCALVLSIPSAILACIARGARMGVLFRGGAPIEKLAEIDCVALDKTGTLTTGELEVIGAESFPPGSEDFILQTAYSLERNSNHPIARAITHYGELHGLQSTAVTDFQSISGHGLRAVSDDEVCFLGRRELFARDDLAEVLNEIPDPPPAITEVWVVHRGLIGRVLLQDRIRSQSAQVLERFHEQGIRTIMLTGDRRSTAEVVGRKIGIQEVRAGLLPEDKVQAILDLKAEGRKVAMVGDGVNDAPSLAAAYVSAGMGARGSDAALEQSEIVLMNDRIEKFLDAFLLSRYAKNVIRWNLVIALGTVVIMMTTSILGLIPLTVGVVAHEGSTVLVCLNSLRLLFVGLRSDRATRESE